MGRRPGSTTKSGRFMNPADQERKSMRQKELKRNRKQRTMVRHAILKSKDVDEILESLSRLDDQEFDLHVEHHSKYVFNEKRAKFKQTYNEVINLYRQEKKDEKVKELEQKMSQYEAERARKAQQFHALRFSIETNPVEIPLPDGSSVPNAAMTPAAPTIPAQYLMPHPRTGILKNTRVSYAGDGFDRAEPPGPPCGPPPIIEDYSNGDRQKRRVRFEEDNALDESEDARETAEDDYGPVEIPAEVMLQHGEVGGAQKVPVPPLLLPTMPPQTLLRAPPLPPSMLPPPPRLPLRMPPPPPNYLRPGMPPPLPFLRTPHGQSVITADPLVIRPDERLPNTENPGATISAGPKLRDLTKEVTKFVPTALRANRNIRHKRTPRYNLMGVQVESAQRKEAKDTDEAYAEFMKEVSSLL